MEVVGVVQTVFGFGCGFDWRPTVFEEAFSPNVVCSACGLLCSTSGLLPCRHVLCCRCYRKCASLGNKQCPLDGCFHRKEDIAWMTITAERLLCCKIRCWNTANGCSAVGTASDIIAHFNDDCQFHAVTCQRSYCTIVQKDVIDHLLSRNCNQDQPQASPTLEGVGAAGLMQSIHSIDQKLTESARISLDAIKDSQEKQTTLERNIAVQRFSREEIEGILAQLELRLGSMCTESTASVLTACSKIESVTTALELRMENMCSEYTNLLTASSRIEDITSALRTAWVNEKDAGKALKLFQESINNRLGTEQLLHLTRELGEKLNVVMAATRTILENTLKSSEALEWTIGGWSKLKEAKTRGEMAINWAANPGLFYGYSILPGAEIVDVEGNLSLRLVFQICKGLYDPLLSWPLQKDIHFKVLHPSERDSVQCIFLSTKNSDVQGLRLPTMRQRILFTHDCIATATLEASGYCLHDQIRVRFEVFP